MELLSIWRAAWWDPPAWGTDPAGGVPLQVVEFEGRGVRDTQVRGGIGCSGRLAGRSSRGCWCW
jgi:hypothetical protein